MSIPNYIHVCRCEALIPITVPEEKIFEIYKSSVSWDLFYLMDHSCNWMPYSDKLFWEFIGIYHFNYQETERSLNGFGIPQGTVEFRIHMFQTGSKPRLSKTIADIQQYANVEVWQWCDQQKKVSKIKELMDLSMPELLTMDCCRINQINLYTHILY